MNVIRNIIIVLAASAILTACTTVKETPVDVLPNKNPSDTTFSITEPFWAANDTAIYGLRVNFETDGDDLFIFSPIGGKARLVLRDSLAKYHPVLSPDGTKIAYNAAPRGKLLSRAHVFVVNADGTNPHDVTPFGGNWREIRWSPDSKKIIFSGRVEEDGEIHHQLVVVDVESSEAKLITRGKTDNYDGSFLSSGNKIVFESGRILTDDGGKVFIMNVDGSNPVPIDTLKIASGDPLPSPSRNELLFIWKYEYEVGTYLVNLDTTQLPAEMSSYLTIPQGGGNPFTVWSPDGNLISFYTDVGTLEGSLNIMERDGHNPKKITSGTNVYYSDWSKDSKKIVYTAGKYEPFKYGIYIYSVEDNSTVEIKLTRP